MAVKTHDARLMLMLTPLARVGVESNIYWSIIYCGVSCFLLSCSRVEKVICSSIQSQILLASSMSSNFDWSALYFRFSAGWISPFIQNYLQSYNDSKSNVLTYVQFLFTGAFVILFTNNNNSLNLIRSFCVHKSCGLTQEFVDWIKNGSSSLNSLGWSVYIYTYLNELCTHMNRQISTYGGYHRIP